MVIVQRVIIIHQRVVFIVQRVIIIHQRVVFIVQRVIVIKRNRIIDLDYTCVDQKLKRTDKLFVRRFIIGPKISNELDP